MNRARDRSAFSWRRASRLAYPVDKICNLGDQPAQALGHHDMVVGEDHARPQ
jgi:hypothetical protein